MEKSRLAYFKKRLMVVTFLAPALIVLFIVVFYPIIYAVYRSFFNWSLLSVDQSTFIGLQNYITALNTPAFLESMRVTLLYSAGTTVPSIALGFALALVLNKVKKGKAIIRSMLLIPMMMAPVVVGLTWRVFFFDSYFGIINYVLSLVGISGPSWLSQGPTAVFAIIILSIWVWFPFSLLVLEAALSKLPKPPFEAAVIDGATPWQCFWKITIPMLQSPLIFVFLLRITTDFRNFDIVHVMTMGGPGRATQLMSLYTFFQGMRAYRLGYANALGVIMMIVLGIICFVIVRFVFKEKHSDKSQGGGLWADEQ